MKKICAILMILVLVMLTAACSSKDIDDLVDRFTGTTDAPKDDSDDKQNAVTAHTAEVTPEATKAPTATPTSTPTPVPTEEVTATPEPEVTEEPTPTEEPVSIGTTTEGVNEEFLNTVFAAYKDFLGDEVEKNEYENFETFRFGLAFIDDDSIPELIWTDNMYHASGVWIAFYNDGEVKVISNYDGDRVGFGEYGGFAYAKYENRILSYYMGMGIQILTQYHLTDGLELMQDFYLEGDVNEKSYFKMDDEDVTEEKFYEVYDGAFEGEEEHPIIWATYDTMLAYYPNLCQGKEIEIFTDMYDQLLEPAYERYSGYVDPKMVAMRGNWGLIRGEVYIDDPELRIWYDINEADQESKNDMMYSNAYIYDNAGFWLSGYDSDGQSIEELNLASYAMPMTYFDGGISEGIDYGWCALCESQDGLDWDCAMCLDDEDHLIIALWRDTGKTYDMDGYDYPLQDWITLTYEREFNEYDYNTVTASVTRSAKDDKDGKYAFIAQEYLVVYPTDTELIAEYNLPEDLDGSDFEIVTLDKDPYVFYVDDSSVIKEIDFEKMAFTRVPAEEYAVQEYYYDYTIFFDGVNDEGTNEGLTAVAMIRDYLG